MKLIIIFITFVSSELHTLITTYTGITGLNNPGTPEFTAVTTLDDQQIDYYDSNNETLIPRQEWMREYTSTDQWREDTEIRKHVQQTYRKNIALLMKRFRQTRGVHVYQRMYGCEWDDETGETRGFDQYGYDGKDYIVLDVKESRYISAVVQGLITAKKWNKNRNRLQLLQLYFKEECVYWLKDFLKSRTALKSKAPDVFLLQKTESSPLVCQATGFYPSEISIIWFRNGYEHHEDVDLGETLPNEDGTFQKTIVLNVPPEELEKNEYICEVEHMGKTIQKLLNEEEFRIEESTDLSPSFINLFSHPIICILILAAGVSALKIHHLFKGGTTSAKRARNRYK